MPVSATYSVKGMHCASCARIIEHKLAKLPQVETVSVNLATDTATIKSDREISPAKLNSLIAPLGYSLESDHHHDHSQQAKLPLALYVALVAFFFMAWEIGFDQALLPKPPGSMWQHNFFLFVLATINLLIFGRQFIGAIVRFLKIRYANMDTLVGIGTVTAYLYSTFILFFPDSVSAFGLSDMVYFDVTAIVIGFILFGKHLEFTSKAKTGQAIQKLLELQAKTAIVLQRGQQLEIPTSEVVVGNHVLVKPGAKIPLDGIIIEGQTAIDESAITGESIPFDKKPGDRVIGGSVNTYAAITVKVTQTGEDTVLAQIVAMVKAAQGSKASIERLADKISAVFVPIVLVIAFATLFGWIIIGNSVSTALSSFVAVLVIACPCAMGLATPTGIIVGVGKGAENGILVKDAESLEKLHQINTIILDKTGTLTYGKPQVTKINPLAKISPSELIGIAASLESLSDHPLASAIVAKARDFDQATKKVSQFANIPGQGVKGKLGRNWYFIGSQELMKNQGIRLPDLSFEVGSSLVWVAKEKTIIGAIQIADQVRDTAVAAINHIKNMSIEPIMATGDLPEVAEKIAQQVNIAKVFSKVMPQQKAEIIIKLQQQGKSVAMVGDGINDSPALATADVGIAMSTGSDIAIESANITILHGDISKIDKSIKLSQMTMRIIKQNLFWAFVYNTIGIPLAAFNLLNPVFAGAAMALSSVSVVGNSLRLKKIKL